MITQSFDYSIFGTANIELDSITAYQMGMAFCHVLENEIGRVPRVFVCKDTRISSDMISSALISGLLCEGADVVLLDVLPFPAACYLTAKYNIDALVMIGCDDIDFNKNGISFYSTSGKQFSKEFTDKVIHTYSQSYELIKKQGNKIGRLATHKNPWDEYIKHISTHIPGSLDGIRLYIDCANGCTSYTARSLFTYLGAECIIENANPNGTNIYENSGIINQKLLGENTVKNHCHAGIAFDNFGQKFVVCDETGAMVDYDKITAALAFYLKNIKALNADKIALTAKANMGLVLFCRSKGIEVLRCPEAMNMTDFCDAENINLASLSNGEMLFNHILSVYDAELSAAMLMNCLSNSDRKMTKLASIMQRCPQVMLHIKATKEQKEQLYTDETVQKLLEEANAALNDEGIAEVYPVTSESFIILTVEGKNFEIINKIAVDLAKKIGDYFRGKTIYQ